MREWIHDWNGYETTISVSMAIDLKNYSAYLIGNVSAVKRKSTATVIVTQVSICTYESYFCIIRFFIFFFEHMIRAKREKRKSISIETLSSDLPRIYVIQFSPLRSNWYALNWTH